MDTPSIPPIRICTKCNQPFPATKEWFYSCKHGKFGLSSWCKACNNQSAREWAKRNPDKAKASDKRYKETHKDKLRTRAALYKAAHKEQQKERDRRRYAENPERERARSRQYNAEHREERIRYTLEWQKRNPEKVSLTESKRRTRKRSLPFSFTGKDWQRCLDYWHNICAFCGKQQDFWHVLEKEHWIALDDYRPDNPGTVPTNIIPSCVYCNSSKWRHDPVEWLNRKFGKRKAKQILKRIEAYFEWIRQQTAE